MVVIGEQLGERRKADSGGSGDRAPHGQGVRGRAGGWLAGIALTGVGCAALALGILRPLDDFGYDVHVRTLSTIEADPRIALIDIDDYSLRAVGDWPWPRRRHAQLIRVLNELGARAVVLDLVLAEASSPRVEMPGGLDVGSPGSTDGGVERGDVETRKRENAKTSDGRVEGTEGQRDSGEAGWLLGGGHGADEVVVRAIIDDDAELRAAMAEGGNVYLAMYFRMLPAGSDARALIAAGATLVAEAPGLSLAAFRDGLRQTVGPLDGVAVPGIGGVEALYHVLRIGRLLEADFGLDVREVAAGLEWGVERVERYMPAAKALVADRMARRFLSEHPDAGFAAFCRAVMGEAACVSQGPDRQDLALAFREARSLRWIEGRAPAVVESLDAVAPRAFDVTPPLDSFAAAARGVGFVSFVREESGGVVRGLPLVARLNDRIVAQLGFLAGVDALGLDRTSIRQEAGRLVVGQGARARRFPISSRGATPIHWHVPTDGRDWRDSFTHVSVTQPLEIALNREAIRENRRRLRAAMAALVRLRHAETPSAYAEYVELARRAQAGGGTSANGSEDAASAAPSDDVEAAIREIEADAMVWLERVHGLWRGAAPESGAERAERDRIMALYAQLGAGRLAERIENINRALSERNAALAAALRGRIEGRICLVGYTASGLADVVPTPAFEALPGVMAHANVVNMVLRNRPLVRASTGANALLLALVGVLITALTLRRGAVAGFVLLLVIVGAVLVVSGTVFYLRAVHLASVPAAAQTCFVWAGVAAHRQFTEERRRRQLQRALSQYTSPAVAARIAEQASVNDLAPRPAEVTCFFSDLEGFTRVSERLGPQRTRDVLNPYLEAASGILAEREALVNKFMGDGVFAFFNAPILACPRHATAACDAALALIEAVERGGARGGASGMPALRVRIGISTGEAFVGDYGSRTKLDYTCIGDTVNVGARLEQINKALGTRILVDAATQSGAREPFLFRSLGRITVPGRTAPVEAFELMGLTDGADKATVEFVDLFEQAVAAYQGCEWDQCEGLLQRCRDLRPGDRAAQYYEQAVARHRQAVDRSAWSGTIDPTPL